MKYLSKGTKELLHPSNKHGNTSYLSKYKERESIISKEVTTIDKFTIREKPNPQSIH